MALMLEHTYDALRDAGASEEKARAAAAELATHENAEMSSDIKLLKWMVGASLGFHIATIGLLLNLSTRHL